MLRESGERIVIDGPCLSACTLVLSTIPRERICVTRRAVLGFHGARLFDRDGNEYRRAAVPQYAVAEIYPKPVQHWIARRGGLTRTNDHVARRGVVSLLSAVQLAVSFGAQSSSHAKLSSERTHTMATPLETAGITRASEGLQGISWNILGQTYVPKSRTEHSFSWHATFPPGTFVPPHVHPDQDEYLYILEGRLDFMLDGADEFRHAGRPGPAADGQTARHLQQVAAARQGAVLGVADPQAL